MLNKIMSVKSKLKKSDTEEISDKHLVALDVGTEFVKALISRITDDGELEIIGTGKVRQSLSDMQAGAISDISSVVANCNSALNEAEKQSGISARGAVIGIAGELVKGSTITVKFKRQKPDQEIDSAEVFRIVEAIQKRAQTVTKNQLSKETGGKDIDIKLVNSALISIDIDGYTVTNPIGFQGTEVTIQLYTAYAPIIHIGALERTANLLDLELLTVAAEPFAVARAVIGDDPNATMSAITMDIGGGTTDIAVVNEGGVEGTKMFGIGGRSFTKSIERDMHLTFNEAEELKLGLSTGKTIGQKKLEVEKSLKKTLRVWLNGVELALSEFKRMDHLPHRILICGGGAGLNMLVEALEKTDWYRDLPFTRKPQIQIVEPEFVVGIYDNSGRANDHTYITAMGLLRVAMDTVDNHDNNDSLKHKFNKLLAN